MGTDEGGGQRPAEPETQGEQCFRGRRSLVGASVVHPDAAFPEIVHHRSPVPWPYVPGQLEEVPPALGLLGQKVGQPLVPLPQIAGGAGGDYVPARMVSPAHPRFDMVDSELLRRELLTAVDAPVPVAGEERLAAERRRLRHRTPPA
jgi:hypothetical protein